MQTSAMEMEAEEIAWIWTSGERLSLSFWDPGGQIWKLFFRERLEMKAFSDLVDICHSDCSVVLEYLSYVY